MIKWGCDIADKKNIPAYIEAAEDGLKLYLKFDFEIVGEFVMNLTHFGGEGEETIAILVRQPRGGKNEETGDEVKK